MEYLEIASNQSYYSWIEANNILSYIYLYIEKDYDKSLEKIEPLVEQYPNHPFFPFLELEALIKLERWDEFNSKFTKVDFFLNHPSTIIKEECTIKYNYLQAMHSYYHGEYHDAIYLTSQIINNYTMEFNWLLGLTYYLRANAYIKISKYDQGKKDLKTVYKFDFKLPEKEYAKELYQSLNK